MKPPAIDYVRADSLDHAQALLAEHADDARILAGGQSLMPLLNMRLASPKVLVDINRIAGLDTIAADGGHLTIGTLARHSDVLRSDRVAERAPLIRLGLRHVAHTGVRNRGTFGGSLALADPAAELPACALTLDAEMVLSSRAGGERTVPARDFFQGLYQTAIRPDEILTQIRVPAARPEQLFAFGEVARRHGDYAILGIAAAASVRDGVLADTALCFFGTGERPARAFAAAERLNGQPISDIDAADAIDAVTEDVTFTGDPQASAELRRHLAGVLLRRALDEIVGGIDSPAGRYLA